MLKAANRAALRLWRDESGVVLALTVVVFLSLFMMASAIFAGGETIRQRIELQNAADAAAYSAAIVQADCNSRLAAINRAMSWTYVRMVRMEMDYIVDKWLWLTLKRWKRDDEMIDQPFNAPSCNQGVPYYVTGYGAALGNRFAHEKILLNYHQLVSKSDIENARTQAQGEHKSYTQLADKIDKCREQINAMNDKEVELLNKMPKRIAKATETVLKANIKDTWNDGFTGGAQIMYQLKQQEQPKGKTFAVLDLPSEDDFLRHSDYIPEQGNTANEVFEDGAGVWFIQKNLEGQPGIQRGYKYGGPILSAKWGYYSSLWVEVDGACVFSSEISGDSEVKGDDSEIKDERYYDTAQARAHVLTKEFFARGGSLRVALTRRLNNPFQFLFGGGGPGVFKPFTLDGGNRFMWTVSAAIAGYNPKPRQEAQGRYEVTYEDNSGDKLWNLKTSDWDAELIPLHRADTLGENRAWKDVSAGRILNEMRNGPWKPLYAGGGAPGAQGAPVLMNGGAALSYGGAEGWVLH